MTPNIRSIEIIDKYHQLQLFVFKKYENTNLLSIIKYKA